MKKIKALGIAPYEGLKDLMYNMVSERGDIDLHVYVGDLAAGAELVSSMQDIGYDVIISRGGTAGMIGEIAHIPVVEIRLSEYDMMRAIKLAQNYSGRFAIVGFPNITKCTEVICDILNCKIDSYTVNSTEEVFNCIEGLVERGYKLLIGDSVTVSTAKKLKINGILITSGKESINAAFDEAIKLCNAISSTRKRDIFYKWLLDISNIKTAVYDSEKNLVYSNCTYEQRDMNLIVNKLKKYVDKVFSKNEIKIMLKTDNCFWSITGAFAGQLEYPLAVFFFSRSYDISSFNRFISCTNPDEYYDMLFTTFYEGCESMKPIVNTVKKISNTLFPVFIYGGNGTGKDSIAYMLHLHGSMKNSFFLTIDFSLLDEKELHLLFEGEDSPLRETDLTIYFKNIYYLDCANQQKMISYIKDTSLHNRNRIIYSSDVTIKEMDCSLLAQYLLGCSPNRCLTLSLPSLRNRREEITSLASICISEFNLTQGKQVIGLEEGAVRLLKDFDWDGNIEQFVNVLKQLVIITDTPYISEANTDGVLLAEKRIFQPRNGKQLSIDGTLDDIVTSVIKSVFAEENMNQSNTAKRLGISRSTLWRKLKLQQDSI